MNDETLYVAPSSPHTDYSQPPMSSFYQGVLNTGRRRYAHPALSGILPVPWLPAIKRERSFGDGARERRGVVLSLRRKMGRTLRRSQSNGSGTVGEGGLADGWLRGENVDTNGGDFSNGSGSRSGSGSRAMSGSQSSNPWGDSTPSRSQVKRKTSYDPVSGIIALPDENVWDNVDDEEDEEDEAEDEQSSGSPVSLASILEGYC
jgi:hypothetical protein